MTPYEIDLLRAFLLLAATNLIALALGWVIGRHAERRAIIRWLWGQPKARSNVAMFCDVERGAHRSEPTLHKDGGLVTRACQIKIAGDSTWCETCELRWDTNDSNPPTCPMGRRGRL